MDRTGDPRDTCEIGLSENKERPDTHPEIEPDSWRDLTEFADQFENTVFGVLADPDDSSEGFWIVEDIKKVRPAAVPIDQEPTFDCPVLGPGGEVVDEIRLTIGEIDHVRAANFSTENQIP
jgi:hypothetical protein